MEDIRSKHWQKPKTNHPWRRYADRVEKEIEVDKKEEKKIKPVKLLLCELTESWENIEVFSTVFGREGHYKLSMLSQTKQAAWLAGLLKRNYA